MAGFKLGLLLDLDEKQLDKSYQIFSMISDYIEEYNNNNGLRGTHIVRGENEKIDFKNSTLLNRRRCCSHQPSNDEEHK